MLIELSEVQFWSENIFCDFKWDLCFLLHYEIKGMISDQIVLQPVQLPYKKSILAFEGSCVILSVFSKNCVVQSIIS